MPAEPQPSPAIPAKAEEKKAPANKPAGSSGRDADEVGRQLGDTNYLRVRIFGHDDGF
jgi:hypothetical protein